MKYLKAFISSSCFHFLMLMGFSVILVKVVGFTPTNSLLATIILVLVSKKG